MIDKPVHKDFSAVLGKEKANPGFQQIKINPYYHKGWSPKVLVIVRAKRVHSG